MIALLSAAFASDPALDGVVVPDGVEVSVDRTADRWIVSIDGRAHALEPPADDAGLAAFRALVASLATRADLATPGTSAAAARALAMVGPPPQQRAPRPPPVVEPAVVPEPPVVEPPAPHPDLAVVALEPLPPLVDLDTPAVPAPRERAVRAWVGADLALRGGVRAGPGVAVGLAGSGLAARLAWRAPRAVARAPGARLEEAEALALAEVRLSALRVGGGVGAVVRRWWTAGALAGLHVVPIASAGLAVPFDVGGRDVALGALAAVDLGVTRVRAAGARWTLSPVTGAVEVRIGGREPDRPPTTSQE